MDTRKIADPGRRADVPADAALDMESLDRVCGGQRLAGVGGLIGPFTRSMPGNPGGETTGRLAHGLPGDTFG